MPLLCPALAVFGPATCAKGGWIEVQPRTDSADALAVEDKVYILPLAHDDPVLAFERRGWIAVHGAADQTVVVTFARSQPPLGSVAPLSGRIIAEEARWLQLNAINNEMTLRNWRMAISPAATERFRRELQPQRQSAGRIELAALAYGWALEPIAPEQARTMRRAARAFGVIASFLGDDFALDFLSDARFAAFKTSVGKLASAAPALEREPLPSPELAAAFDDVIKSTLVARGDTFAERPPADPLPCLPSV